jgi:hypothetical protein
MKTTYDFDTSVVVNHLDTQEPQNSVPTNLQLGELPEQASLLEHIKNGDKEAQDDWNKRAEAGEIMRII